MAGLRVTGYIFRKQPLPVPHDRKFRLLLGSCSLSPCRAAPCHCPPCSRLRQHCAVRHCCFAWPGAWAWHQAQERGYRGQRHCQAGPLPRCPPGATMAPLPLPGGRRRGCTGFREAGFCPVTRGMVVSAFLAVPPVLAANAKLRAWASAAHRERRPHCGGPSWLRHGLWRTHMALLSRSARNETLEGICGER